MPTPLSSADLGVFFEPHHQELASSLGSALADLPAAERDLDSAGLAAALGSRFDLYRWLMPGSGEPDVRALCLIREALGYTSPLADAIFAVQGLGSYPVALCGTVEQQAVLPRLATGELIGAFALTEPEAGSDVASMRTTATRDGDVFVLDGHKTLISNVGIATHYVVFANANPAAGRKGIAAFWVPADSAGLREAAIELNLDHPIGEIFFDRCRVPASALLGEVGGGFRLAMQTLDTFRVTVGAAAVGMARRALDEAVAHVSVRVQFGKPLAEQQLVQSYLADMATELDAARLLVLRAAHRKDTSDARASKEVAMAKLFATEAAQRIIDHAVQLHGGMGVTAGAVVENLYRAIRPLRIYEGTSEIQRLIIGSSIVKEHAHG